MCRGAIFLLLAAISVDLLAVQATERPALDGPLVLTQVPRVRRSAAPVDRDDWFAGARLVFTTAGGQVRVLSEGFHSACDPDVSFDGKRVLFAGKKDAAGPWRIWEIGVDGQGLRAISPETMNARSPIHVSALFTLDSPQPWFTLLFVGREVLTGEAGQTQVSSLYNIKLDGTELRRLTYNPNRNFDPIQMWDGRVIYCAERFPNEPGGRAPRVGLYAIHIEGADMEFFGGRDGGLVQHMPCSMALDKLLFVEPEENAPDGAGRLVAVKESKPHFTYHRFKQETRYLYAFPSPLSEGKILVSRRGTGKRADSGVFAFDTQTGVCEPVFDSPEYHDVQAKVVAARQRPDGHSTVVDAKSTTGTLYGLNAYDADPRLAPHLQPGTIKRVRFIEGVPQPSSRGETLPQPFVPRRLVGEAPVEADGSFNVEVPADVPLLLQILDDRGLALANCGWIWVKPKETRGCIGCHEDPERTPVNDYVLALRRGATRLTLSADQRRTLGFREDVAPILAKNCAAADCHGGKQTRLKLPLGTNSSEEDFRKSYSALMTGTVGKKPTEWPREGKYVDPGRARTSWLVWQLAGTNTSRPWDSSQTNTGREKRIHQMPTAGKEKLLSAEELRTVIQWVDMGAQYERVKAVGVPPQTLAAGKQ